METYNSSLNIHILHFTAVEDAVVVMHLDALELLPASHLHSRGGSAQVGQRPHAGRAVRWGEASFSAALLQGRAATIHLALLVFYRISYTAYFTTNAYYLDLKQASLQVLQAGFI